MEPLVSRLFRSAHRHGRRLARGLALLLAVAVASAAVEAAVPLSLDRDVSDITPWLKPLNETPGEPSAGGDDGNERWLALELVNPTKKQLHRIVTLESASGGIMHFLGGFSPARIDEVMDEDEEGRARLIRIGGEPAVEITLEPLTTAKFVLYSQGSIDNAVWRIWKPDALAAAKQTATLLMGLLAGAALALAAWLAGLTVFRRSSEPAWAALALAALVVLILGGSFLRIPIGALEVAGAVMIAAGLRYVVEQLSWERSRPRIALALDGFAFAIIGFAVALAFGVTDARMFLQVLAVVGPAAAAVLTLYFSLNSGSRVKAMVPGVALMLAALVAPAFLSTAIADAVTNIPLFADAVFTAGALALAFAAAVPREPELSERAVEELSTGQRKAREAEYRYALGLAAAHQGLWDWNFETDELFVSPSVEALLGLEPGALANSERKWAEMIVADDMQLYADSLNAHRRQGNSSFTLELRMRNAKSGQRWIQLRASCIANTHGKAIRCIGLVSDITGRKAQEAQRVSDEEADAVTGLMLRNTFLSRLDGVLKSIRAGQTRRHGAMLAIDVDRVRVVTDGMGHQAGDRFLAQIARRLDHAAGPDDAVARLGTDEFAVLVLGSRGDEDGAQVAERIRDALSQPVAVGDKEVYPAASIGLALIEPGHRFGGDVLREAEIAMYHAKRTGRGGFEIYQPQMKPRSADRLIMDTDLRTALERGQIEMHYQPIMRLEDGSIAGFEALMRWRHPSRGVLSPGDFIALAEETGLIVPMGRYAVEKATGELKRWQSYFPAREPLFCSVNVSARQLFRHEYFDDVAAVLRREKPARQSLKLELTESVIMQNPETTARTLAELKEAGAGLALDDFGTGFSSLAYLQRFPFDTVKIDRSFVADMAKNQETPVVLRSIIRLAHDLDMSVVAEGVETQAEAARLKQLGCEFAQGFLFGQPMDATAAYNFIALKAGGADAPLRGLPRPEGSGSARVPR